MTSEFLRAPYRSVLPPCEADDRWDEILEGGPGSEGDRDVVRGRVGIEAVRQKHQAIMTRPTTARLRLLTRVIQARAREHRRSSRREGLWL